MRFEFSESPFEIRKVTQIAFFKPSRTGGFVVSFTHSQVFKQSLGVGSPSHASDRLRADFRRILDAGASLTAAGVFAVIEAKYNSLIALYDLDNAPTIPIADQAKSMLHNYDHALR